MYQFSITCSRPSKLGTEQITKTLNIYLKKGENGKADLAINFGDTRDKIDGVLTARDFDVACFQDMGSLIVKAWPGYHRINFTIDPAVIEKNSQADALQWLIFGLTMAHYQYRHSQLPVLNYKLPEHRLDLASASPDLERAAHRGVEMAQGVAVARELMNKPANILTPQGFINAVETLPLENICLNTKTEELLEEEGFGGLVGAGQGSDNPPRLLKLDYYPPLAKPQIRIALVGKGVTFDSGGLSIKRARKMSTMKFAMGGAAAVVGAMHAASQLQLPVHIVGYCALAENMPSPSAQRPGDVIHTLSGKTVEVVNTNAEGQLVLADALWYAQNNCRPDYLVDIATLTGGVDAALGKAYAGVFGNDNSLMESARHAGKSCAELLWPLPLGNWFEEQLKSHFADLGNSHEDRHGSPSVAAAFLQQFIKPGMPWLHMDITAVSCDMNHRPLYDDGATGFGTLLLISLIRSLCRQPQHNSQSHNPRGDRKHSATAIGILRGL